MEKKSNHIESDNSSSAAEPIAVYEGHGSSSAGSTSISAREQILANTVSVDQYFDELISLVRGVRGASVHQNS